MNQDSDQPIGPSLVSGAPTVGAATSPAGSTDTVTRGRRVVVERKEVRLHRRRVFRPAESDPPRADPPSNPALPLDGQTLIT